MSEELNKEEVKEETKENIIEDNKEGKKPKNNKWLKIKRVAVLIIVMLIIGVGIFFSNKIIVPPAQEPIENIYIGKVEFTKDCKKEIKKIQSDLLDVYKIRNAYISNKILHDIEKYVDNPDANIFLLDNEIRVEFYTEDEKIPYLTKEQQENPKVAFKGELEKILKLLDAEDKYNVDDFETELGYADNGRDYIEVTFSDTIFVNSEYGFMGNPLGIAIRLDKNNDLKFLSYDHYDMKKINKRYRLKNAIDILVDIKLNNNVFIETADGSSDYTGKDGNDVVIDSVEVVYDYPQYVDEYKHIVPYYVLSGTKKQGDVVRITMPAIKNRYLWVKN